jgi:sortase A
MKFDPFVALKNSVAWTLITLGLVLLGKVGLDAARATIHQRHLQSALRETPQSRQPVATTPAATALGEPIGWLEIPRIKLSAAVVHGDTDELLKTAIGHLPDTPLPWTGGNSALAGHRDSFFRPLRDVRRDDRVHLETPHGDFEYRVHETLIVEPEDVWVLDSAPAAMLTLITCYPFEYVGNAPRRFIVRAARVQSPQEEVRRSETRLRLQPSAPSPRAGTRGRLVRLKPDPTRSFAWLTSPMSFDTRTTRG